MLKSRIKKIEKAISGVDGIPAWAMRIAEMRAREEPSNIESIRSLNDAIRAAGGKVEDYIPKARFTSRAAVESYARELGQKYRNEKEYRNRPIDPEDFKGLEAAIAAVKL